MAKDKLHDIVEVALVKDGWINIKSITLDYEGIDIDVQRQEIVRWNPRAI